MAIQLYHFCRKCNRGNNFTSEDNWLESIQIGCSSCNRNNWPKYYPEYNTSSETWNIIKEHWITKKSWFGFGPLKEYLVEEILRFTTGDARSLELEFETLNEARDYIKIFLK